ncbi:tRNA1(Val) (adenine(37)-N6)-methyltransferase [Anaeromicrobium sediminis]|uniref:SAM-dependent methyltransferase n=1 Tax=Anaeromicrobium sediminis TaxID=1478221 RepID=A0A267MF51_9FIRM|nr:tRNA1(Val) (adenine(37)-N6)-methyltransferase [Anaeromicrobium sediminis]PAB58087.1 SAM-dependent methyltransferase [Anaeromicrobium sediminis]
MNNLILPHERVDDLQCKGLRLIQNPKGFCFGIDAVLLSNFAQVKTNSKVMDLGTGTGIIPILLAGKTDAKEIVGIEIQEEVANMANRSVKLNNLEDRVKILNEDLKEIPSKVENYTFDVVVSNPPYMNSGGGLLNPESMKAISRHEVKCNLEDVIYTAFKMLKDRGSFYMIHRPHRLVDIIYLCRKYKLEPKRIRFIHPNKNKKPNIFLIECTKYGRPELKFMDPLYVYTEDGQYTEEIHNIYGRDA